MKKCVIITILSLLILSAYCQKQIGYVKSCGSPYKKGVPLENVFITAENANTVVSDKNGFFSILLNIKNGKPYKFTEVYKNDYEIVDTNFYNKTYVFSSEVPIEIILISRQDLALIKNKTEEKIRKNIEKSFEVKINELKEKLNKKEIEQKKYEDELNLLRIQNSNSRKLITDVVEEYSRIDFDRLDSLDTEILVQIRNGNLLKVKDLIKNKGKINNRKEYIINSLSVIKDDSIRIDNERENNRNLSVKLNDEKNKLIQDYKNLFVVELQNSNVDSAAMCLKSLVEIEPSNPHFLFDYADFLYNNKIENYGNLKILFNKILNLTDDQILISKVISRLAIICYFSGDFDNALKNYSQLVPLYERFISESKDDFKAELAIVYSNMANIYRILKQNDSTVSYLNMALKIDINNKYSDLMLYNKIILNYIDNDNSNSGIVVTNSDVKIVSNTEVSYKSDVDDFMTRNKAEIEIVKSANIEKITSLLYGNTAFYYEINNDYNNAIKYYKLITNTLKENNENIYLLSKAYTGLLRLHNKLVRNEEFDSCFNRLITVYKNIDLNNNEEIIKIDFLEPFVTIGRCVMMYNRNELAEVCFEEAFKILENNKFMIKSDYLEKLAKYFYVLSNTELKSNNYFKAESLLQKSLKLYKLLNSQHPEAYNKSLFEICDILSEVYEETKQYENSMNFSQESLSYANSLYFDEENLFRIAKSYNKLAFLQAQFQYFNLAEINIKKSIEFRVKLCEFDSLNYMYGLFNMYRSLASIQQKNDKKIEAEESYLNAIKYYKCIHKTDSISQSELGNTFFNLGMVQYTMNKFDSTLLNLGKAIEIYKILDYKFNDQIREFLIKCYENFGSLQHELNMYDAAELSYKELINVLSLSVDFESKSKQAYYYNKLAVVQSFMKKYSEAQNNLLVSIYIRKELFDLDANNQSKELVKCYKNLALIQDYNKDYENSDISYKEVIKYINVLLENDSSYFEELGDTYNSIAVEQSKLLKYDNAIFYLNKSLETKKKLVKKEPAKYYKNLINVYENLIQIFEFQNKYTDIESSYLEMRELYLLLEKNNINMKKEIIEIEMKISELNLRK